jgi:hypothetical protein
VQGLLWKVVRASMTLVGLLPPALDESGDLLVGSGKGGDEGRNQGHQWLGKGEVLRGLE